MKDILSNLPESLQDAIVYFSDPDRAQAIAVALRWPNGVTCPRCGSRRHSFISTRRLWFCKGCQKQFTVKVGSIFEDSPLGMDKWMTAFWLAINCKNGISSCELARHLKITQKSAWHMLHRVRFALHSGSFDKKLSGEVEADETFIGGKARFMHKGKRLARRGGRPKAPGPDGKAIVAAVLERGGKVRAQVMDSRRKRHIQALVRQNVEPGAALYSDDLQSYTGLSSDYAHQVIDHAEAYVNGRVHTNGLENFWSLLKIGINGTYISVEPFHLFRYIDEQSYRYNNRKVTDAERFVDAMGAVSGKRLTWDRLTGKATDPQTRLN